MKILKYFGCVGIMFITAITLTFADGLNSMKPTRLAQQSVSPSRSQGLGNEFSNRLGMKFVYIPPGTFIMGSPENESGRGYNECQHRVTLSKGYYLQTTEVTQGQWKAIMGNNPSKFMNCGDNCPVDTVSWDDIQLFISKLIQKEGKNYRLPTEAEWEYACRAGGQTAYSNGNSISVLNTMGWYAGNSGLKRMTQLVGQKQANAWGLYDMHGNVLEWCRDWYEDYNCTSVTDPIGPSSGTKRVLRGGGWTSASHSCRSANRHSWFPAGSDYTAGFRLAISKQ